MASPLLFIWEARWPFSTLSSVRRLSNSLRELLNKGNLWQANLEGTRSLLGLLPTCVLPLSDIA